MSGHHAPTRNLSCSGSPAETGDRIQMITQDAETEQPLSRRDLVKGYEFKKNTYVLLTDTDFESVTVEARK